MDSLQRCVVAPSQSTTANPPMTVTTTLRVLVVAVALLIGAAAGTERDAAAALPPGNTVEQWNKIAEDTVVGSGAFQIEGLIYMAYESSAVYDAVVSLQGGYQPLEPAFRVSKTASPDAAVVAAAYRTLRHYFPAAYASLDASYAEALAAIPDGPAKVAGVKIGLVAANQVIRARSVDGLMMPIGISSSFPTLKPGPGVWRLTPPFAPAQIPWAAGVHPFILQSAAQFLPAPPPSLSSPDWVSASTRSRRTAARTAACVPSRRPTSPYSGRRTSSDSTTASYVSIVDARQLNLLQTARLAAMVNVVGADTGIATMNAKYHYLLWRPVSAIDPTAVAPDGYGPVPGYDDGNPATVEQAGWRPLLVTPNHPEYPAAHGALTGAMAAVFTAFLGSSQINLDIHGFDPNGPSGKPERGGALQQRGRPPNRDRQRARLGRRPLPLLRPRRGHPRLEGRRVRPRTRLPTNRLIPAPATSARAR